MGKQWVLVADAAAARLYSRRIGQSLSRVDALYHEPTRQHTGDLRTGGEGTLGDAAAHGRHQPEPQTPTADKHADAFAKTVAERLKSGLNAHAFDELVLVAEPRFLGRLRDHLDAPLTQRIAGTLPKDWTGQSDDRIQKQLESQLG